MWKDQSTCLLPVFLGITVMMYTGAANAQWDATAEMDYVKRFEENFPPVSPVPSLNEYATAARYDKLYLGKGFEKAVDGIREDPEGLAWGWSYRMMSLNEMYRATKDPK